MQPTITRHLDARALEFDLGTALKFLKMPADTARAGQVREQLTELHAKMCDTFQPCYQYRVLQVAAAPAPDTIVLQNEMATLRGKAIYRRLARTRAAVLFLLTIGDDFARAAQRKEEAMLDAIFIDAVASTLVQATLQILRETLQGELENQGFKLTPHLSPGYPGWDLSEQVKLFDLLQPAKIGMHLSSSCFMIPQKSLSGVFGVLPK